MYLRTKEELTFMSQSDIELLLSPATVSMLIEKYPLPEYHPNSQVFCDLVYAGVAIGIADQVANGNKLALQLIGA